MILDLSNMLKHSLWQSHSRFNVYKGAVGLWSTLPVSSPACHFNQPCLRDTPSHWCLVKLLTLLFTQAIHHGTSSDLLRHRASPTVPHLTPVLLSKPLNSCSWQCPSYWPNEGRSGVCRQAGLCQRPMAQGWTAAVWPTRFPLEKTPLVPKLSIRLCNILWLFCLF